LVWKRKNTTKEARMARRRERERIIRRKQGMRTREEFIATSARHTKPWAHFGIGWREWYRRGKPMPPGSAEAT
jgi:hypothetical protein